MIMINIFYKYINNIFFANKQILDTSSMIINGFNKTIYKLDDEIYTV